MVALVKIDPQLIQRVENCLILDKLCHYREPHCMGDVGDGFHHGQIEGIGIDIPDKASVDFQTGYRQMLF